MNKNKAGFSLGSILAIVLTLAVSAGCLLFFSGMLGEDHDVRMDAKTMIRVLGDALQGPTHEPQPYATVRTVTVTLAPQIAATPEIYMAPAPTPDPAQQALAQVQEYSFSLTLGGVIGFHSDISDSVYQKDSKTFDYAPIFSYLGDEVHADLNLAMLDGALNTADQKYSDTYAPAACLDGVKTAGFDGLFLNGEHALDHGAQGALDMIEAIQGRGFLACGINGGNAYQNQMISLNGSRVAILSYTDVLTAKGKNALETSAGYNMMVPFSSERAQADILAAKKQGAHCVIVSLYWGREETEMITATQRKTMTALAEAGADLIVGMHPSRVLPMEWIETKDAAGQTRKTLAVYSLGTLLTESRDGYDISGLLLHLSITCRTDGRVEFDAVEYTPTYIWRQHTGERWQYRVVASADAPPEGMEQKQREVMDRALNRIRKILEDSPAVQRQ